MLLVCLPLCGCAVAVTANVVLPTPASSMEVRPASVQAVPPSAALTSAPPPSPAPTFSPTPGFSASPTPVYSPAPSPTAAQTPAQTAAPSPTPAYEVEEMEEAGYIYAGSVNLRSGPGTDYEVLEEYARNTKIVITGRCGDWCRVEVKGEEGFMLREYIKYGSPQTPSPTPKSTPKATPKPTQTPIITPTPEASATPAQSTDGDDLTLIAQIVYKEGDAESYVAVANVIYNRVQSSKFPNTIRGVIYQANQFSTSGLKTPSSAAVAAVKQVFQQGDLILPANVLYFRVSSRGSTWGSRTFYATYGENSFFS